MYKYLNKKEWNMTIKLNKIRKKEKGTRWNERISELKK
jgi:hypothetical protein